MLESRTTKLYSVTQVYDANGCFVQTVASTHPEDPKDLDLNLIGQALKTVEDHSFDSHIGISPRAIIRALARNLRTRGIREGGSTITQQLFRTLVPFEPRILRKCLELVVSPIMTLTMGRIRILNMYAYKAFWGVNYFGAAAASTAYFRKRPEDLNHLQAIALAALLSKPNYWLKHPHHLAKKICFISARRNLKFNTTEVLATTKKISKNYCKSRQEYFHLPKAGSYLATTGRGKAKIQITINRNLQHRLWKLCNRIQSHELLVTVVNVKKWQIAALYDRMGGHYLPTLSRGRVAVGSLLKPFLLIACARRGIDPKQLCYESMPLEISHQGAPWSVRNYRGQYRGKINLVEAVIKSDNSVCVQALNTIGLDTFRQVLIDYGVVSHEAILTPAIVLGASEHGLCPSAILRAYAAIATGKLYESGPALTMCSPCAFSSPLDDLALVRSTLMQVIERGTADILLNSGLNGGKTGTDNTSACFIGFNDEYLIYIQAKERHQELIEESELIRMTKAFTPVSLCKSIVREIGRVFGSVFNSHQYYGQRKGAA